MTTPTSITRSTRIRAEYTVEQDQHTTHIPYAGDTTTYAARWNSDEPGGDIYTPRTLADAMQGTPGYWRCWLGSTRVIVSRDDLLSLTHHRIVDELRLVRDDRYGVGVLRASLH